VQDWVSRGCAAAGEVLPGNGKATSFSDLDRWRSAPWWSAQTEVSSTAAGRPVTPSTRNRSPVSRDGAEPIRGAILDHSRTLSRSHGGPRHGAWRPDGRARIDANADPTARALLSLKSIAEQQQPEHQRTTAPVLPPAPSSPGAAPRTRRQLLRYYQSTAQTMRCGPRPRPWTGNGTARVNERGIAARTRTRLYHRVDAEAVRPVGSATHTDLGLVS
jgi:hypothetical protein